MTNYESMKDFLEAALAGISISYGYPRMPVGVSQGNKNEVHCSYELVGMTPMAGIGQKVVSRRETYMVYIQSAYAKTCSSFINTLLASMEDTNIEFISSSVRADPSVANGCIGSVSLSIFRGS